MDIKDKSSALFQGPFQVKSLRGWGMGSIEVINFMIMHKIFVQMYGMEKYILKMFKKAAASNAGNKILLFFV